MDQRERLLTPSDPTQPVEPSLGAAAPAVGQLEGLEFLEVLGQGGMAVVYKARQRKLDRLVAVKMISAGANAGAEARSRFRREAEAIARLHHPNIVQIYEVGDGNGAPYVVLELVHGGSLAKRLDGTPLPVRRAAELVVALARAEWDLAQKHQKAPHSGLVFDTLYRPGEWVPAGHPVVVLLPPPNIKVRAFVPETWVGALKVGQGVRVFVDGVPDAFPGTLSYISPRAEYTPPVIYSRESRAKLVFLIEARFDPRVAVSLHPGQPVDIEFGD
jgi:hypothetical protein